MKLIETLKTIVSHLTNALRGWTIKTRWDYKKTYEIFFVPTVRYNDWSATRMVEGEDGEFKDSALITDYSLSIAFLTAITTISLYKETPVGS